MTVYTVVEGDAIFLSSMKLVALTSNPYFLRRNTHMLQLPGMGAEKLPDVFPSAACPKYIRYYLTASNGRDMVCIPFEYDFISNILHDGRRRCI